MAKKYEKITGTLAGVGAVNWGLVEFLNWNAVTFLAELPVLKEIPALGKIIYGAVAVSGLVVIARMYGWMKK